MKRNTLISSLIALSFSTQIFAGTDRCPATDYLGLPFEKVVISWYGDEVKTHYTLICYYPFNSKIVLAQEIPYEPANGPWYTDNSQMMQNKTCSTNMSGSADTCLFRLVKN